MSYLFIFSDHKSLRSSMIILLIKYTDKLIFKVLFGSRVKAMAAAHSVLDLRKASQKNSSGESTSHPQTFFNTSINTGKSSKLPDSFLQEISIWKVAKGKKNCEKLENFLTSSLN